MAGSAPGQAEKNTPPPRHAVRRSQVEETPPHRPRKATRANRRTPDSPKPQSKVEIQPASESADRNARKDPPRARRRKAQPRPARDLQCPLTARKIALEHAWDSF